MRRSGSSGSPRSAHQAPSSGRGSRPARGDRVAAASSAACRGQQPAPSRRAPLPTAPARTAGVLPARRGSCAWRTKRPASARALRRRRGRRPVGRRRHRIRGFAAADGIVRPRRGSSLRALPVEPSARVPISVCRRLRRVVSGQIRLDGVCCARPASRWPSACGACSCALAGSRSSSPRCARRPGRRRLAFEVEQAFERVEHLAAAAAAHPAFGNLSWSCTTRKTVPQAGQRVARLMARSCQRRLGRASPRRARSSGSSRPRGRATSSASQGA